MFQCMVGRNGNEAEIRFPCEESDIRRVQRDLQIPYPSDTRVTVLGMDSDIEQLSVLEGQQADLDFLNLLGRMMYGLDEREYKQFQIGLYHESVMDLKGIMNVLADVHRYSIIDLNDMEKSGLEHEFDVRGGIPTDEIKNTDYAPAAQILIDSGKCINTPYGILFVNEEMPVPDFFDGQHMPAYYDRDFQFSVSLHNDTDEDFISLPCSDEELLRAAKRLNTSFPYDLKVRIEDAKDCSSELIDKLIEGADVCTLNRYARLIDGFIPDIRDKYMAALSYVDKTFEDTGGLRSLDAAVKIGGALHAFSYYPNAMSDYELGCSAARDRLPDESFEVYFDFERYGRDLRMKQDGVFSEDGYVGLRDGNALRQQLTQKNSMDMGGMV